MAFNEIMIELLPIGLLFAVGWGLRRQGRVERRHADWLLRIVVWIGLPALIFAALSRLPLGAEWALLPLLGALMVVLMWPLAWFAGRMLGLPRPMRGVLITGPMIMNLAFVYPFAVAWGGDGAVARLALLDFGNGLLSFTLVYGLAAWYGRRDARTGAAVIALLTFPPFWALCLALFVNGLGWPLPERLMSLLSGTGTALVLLVPLALGIYFRPAQAHGRALLAGLGLRLGGGTLLGLMLVSWFPLDELSRTMVLAAALAPVGFNTLVFAAHAGLDRDLAASLASVSMPIAFTALLLLFSWRPPAAG